MGSSGSTAATSNATSTRRFGTQSTTPTSTAASGPPTRSTCAPLSRHEGCQNRPKRPIGRDEPGDVAPRNPPGVNVLDRVAICDVADEVVAQEVLAADAGPRVQPATEVRPYRAMDA